MGRFLNLKRLCFQRKNRSPYLALCFSLGLIAGAVLAAASGSSLNSMIPLAADKPGSLSGVLLTALLPFGLSAFVGLIGELLLLYPIVFWKAFLVSFIGVGVMGAYGSAGWLMRLLLLFSECCTLPLLILFWIRLLTGQGSRTMFSALNVLAAVLIGSLDYCIVSPFLANVIS